MKFRIYDKNSKKFIAPTSALVDCDGNVWSVHDGFCIKQDFIVQLNSRIKDIDGKEIYEGDIVKTMDISVLDNPIQYKRGLIVFNRGNFQIQEHEIGASNLSSYIMCSCCSQHSIKILGNIFDTKI